MNARKRFFSVYPRLLLISFFSSFVFSEIVIDGKLSEEEWELAREINKFYEVFPFSLNDVSGNTRVLIVDDEKGIYFGFILFSIGLKESSELLSIYQKFKDL